ncbi:hypothetical protein GGS23DRAFT_569879 [Durotheca rogersii]|uniref:uncharacterized protein n=1 Tax=Durotheca rogersii TaxID=419775 RepID=UPI00221FCB4B|nr:uncharacterized protein GGS23DRAFT_569879 [Durotheca rogersii]KAI5862879.1 hypothetical protein GGS23DRAFT_569879 [Durotheca rogersii]
MASRQRGRIPLKVVYLVFFFLSPFFLSTFLMAHAIEGCLIATGLEEGGIFLLFSPSGPQNIAFGRFAYGD